MIMSTYTMAIAIVTFSEIWCLNDNRKCFHMT